MKLKLLSIIALLTLSVCLSGGLSAQVVTTGQDDGSQGSLRSQIENAAAGATITFSPTVSTVNLTSEIAIENDITITGLPAANTNIDAGGNSRIFNVVGGTVVLNNLSLRNGVAADGGGIFNSSDLTMNNCFVSACVANGASGSGGGVFNSTGGVFTANTSQFNGNVANRAGGAIEDNSGIGVGITLNNVSMTENNAGAAPAATAAPGNGGAFHITGMGDAVVMNCIVTDNIAAAEGGGLWNSIGTMAVTSSNIGSNTAVGDGANQGGGGLFNAGGNLVIDDCQIFENVTTGPSTSGGGVLNDMGVLTVINSSFTNNTSIRAGGGIEDNSVAGNTMTITNTELSFNSTGPMPGNGGGLHITGPGDAMISDCTVTGNTATAEGGGLWNSAGTMTVSSTMVEGNSAIGDGANQGGGGLFNAGGTLNVIGGTVSDNSTTGPSTSGGGILNDVGTLSVSGTEIKGNSSVRAGGGIEDNSDEGGMLALNNVIFSENATGPMPGNGGGLHITGAGASDISECTFENNTATAEGGGVWNNTGEMNMTLCIVTGNSAVGDGADQGGGGVFNRGGTLNINGGKITENSTTGPSTSGGGILNDLGVLSVNGTEISANTTIRAGGGIEDNSAVGNTLTLLNVLLTDNTTGSMPGNGGGLHITGPGDVTITDCTVTGNTAEAEGGGLWNSAGTMNVMLSTIEGNTAVGDGADEGGGGIFNNTGTLIVDACDIENNSTTGPSTSGGGILNNMGVLTVTNSSLVGNSTIRAGGGIEDNSVEGNTLTLTNVFLTDNSTGAMPGNGGGLHITGPGDSKIADCSVTGNSAAAEGGGLWNSTGLMTVFTTTVQENSAGGDGANQGGGGIFNAGGKMIVDGSNLIDNETTGPSTSGGGILNDLGSLTVSNSTFTGNSAIRAGGGIEENSADTSLLIIRNTMMMGNTTGAMPGNGGALHVTGAGDTEITDSVISGNTAALEGGGLWNDQGFMKVSNTDVDSNTATGAAADNGGGGVFNNGGVMSIQDGTMIRNNLATGAAGSGGGLLSVDGLISVENAEFISNSANRAGGAIEIIDGQLDFAASSMIDNDVNGGAGTAAPGNGGGLHVTGMSTAVGITESIITGNEAGREGGGLWNQAGSTMIVATTTIDGNSSFGVEEEQGGAGVFNNGGNLEIASSTISNNTDMGVGASGAGVLNRGDGEVTIRVSTISGNSSTQGGGIYNSGVALTVQSSTIAFNSASVTGGGIHSPSATTMGCVIVSDNSAPTGSNLSGSAIGSTNYNLIASDAEGVFTAESDDILNEDPLLIALNAEGQITATHDVEFGSPVFNAGNPDDMGLDQNGNEVFGGRRDIGSSEAQEILSSTEVLTAAESNIRIFPNPTNNQTSIVVPFEFGEDVTISIYASTGQLISELAANNGTNLIQLGTYPNGSYMIRVNSSTFTSAQLVNKID